jgi:adenine-specific DNA-methyltransferase
MVDMRERIKETLIEWDDDLRLSALQLLSELGYTGQRTISIPDADPSKFLQMLREVDTDNIFSEEKALYDSWVKADLLFQLTDKELANQNSLFSETKVYSSLMQSYLFFAVELQGNTYARGKLAQITRQINRVFLMPVMVLYKYEDTLSIAVINRRRSKRDEDKDVLGKVTLIHDVSLLQPHRGHLDILASFTKSELAKRFTVNSFDSLHAAWEEIFNVELLNERFYRELSDWYFWALDYVRFPDDVEKNSEVRNANNLIRLLTRLIFCWFLKERDLIPEKLFDEDRLAESLKSMNSHESTYYHAILQNLFFATLNQQMNSGTKINRKFTEGGDFIGNRTHYGIKNLYRYKEYFKNSDDALELFKDVPFLNGGLFECLDKEDDAGKVRYIDGFTRNEKKQPFVPNELFFLDEERTVDLSKVFGDNKRKKEKVRGLIHILSKYKFTIVENTPIEQEIALDPELLGKVFENLLASYNEETRTTARKQTGSFYTPRTIVGYMVDISLKEYLMQMLVKHCDGMSNKDAKESLEILFSYTEKEHTFNEREKKVLIGAIDSCKIIDPACGSGAFPMGILHKFVSILGKLDPNNKLWKQRQLETAEQIQDSIVREEAKAAIDEAFERNELDYGRKLYLIENCIHGVDIQPIAIQISKLRFFISLVCDQKTNNDREKNLGVLPLPNLETKFVVADSLIKLPGLKDVLEHVEVESLRNELQNVRHRYFSVQRRQQKLELQRRDDEIRTEIRKILGDNILPQESSELIVDWNPYDSHSIAGFFDSEWMFGTTLEDGFDVVIGNPPFVQIQKFSGQQIQKDWEKQNYDTFTKSGDMYCLFYERGYQLLREQGVLTFISSNKWMRALYGKRLRRFFLTKTSIAQLIDFGDSPIFSAATYTNVMLLEKGTKKQTPKVWDLSLVYQKTTSLASMLKENGPYTYIFNEEAFVITPHKHAMIKLKVEKMGVPLKDWEITMYRGIITGLNKAFIINGKKRDELIAKDPKSADIIKPILRGRDIKRYCVEFVDIWVLVVKFGDYKALRTHYPAVFQHLQQYEKQLKARGQCRYNSAGKTNAGDYPGQHHWLELDNNLKDEYLNEFEKEKIIYAEIVYDSAFYYDNSKVYTEATAFVLTGDSTKYLTSLLNSQLLTFVFRVFYAGGDLRGNTFRYKKTFLQNLPVIRLDAPIRTMLELLVEYVQYAKAKDQILQATYFEQLIDGTVYELYFPDEIRAANKEIQSNIGELTHISDDMGIEEKLAVIQSEFNRLYDPHHTVRKHIETLDSVDVVHTIREAMKSLESRLSRSLPDQTSP